MKWKITSRFLAAIIITIIISLFGIMFLNIMIFYKGPKDPEKLLSVNASSITLEFGENIKYQDGKIHIPEDKLQELENYQSWIQVLDEDGNEIFQKYKPAHAPNHYTPGKLIFYHKYSGAIKGYTIFVGILDVGGRNLSYIMGFPVETVAKASFYFNPKTIIRDMLLFFAGTTVIIILISSIVGYLFSAQLAKPILKVISGIQALAEGKYVKKEAPKGIYKDVHKSLNHLSDTLEQNEMERRKTEKMREEWITNITHDLKTPLASIKGYSEVLVDSKYDLVTEERIKYASIILSKSKYMENLVEDLKLTYQLKNELIPLNRSRENIVEVVRDTIIDILNHPQYEEAPISFEAGAEGIMFFGDQLLLKRAISNLIYNALVHNPKGTEIRVRVKKAEQIIIEIEDNGKGIEPEELDRLFDRYYRGTNTGEAHKGSGLGLAIAKQIIEVHNGDIYVESKLNYGTKVTVLFGGQTRDALPL
ncbi:sensor histidine kinase [Bacillus methanolicus]|uniref:sensor histidine kinase n=1 Tax=Bacillus methanolicus TaxID=1471 RepID=UPI002380782A|nr:HAMP domain-containing sensor histidine kinase [Bacillus methanolicus]MDE3837849.1 sensor histidine kinase [Bacillus methanolicus]